MPSHLCRGLQSTAKWHATSTRMLPVWVLTAASCDTAAKQFNGGGGGAEGAVQILAEQFHQD